MNSRMKSIRGMFKADDEGAEPTARAASPRVASGAVRSMKDSLTNIEAENEELRRLLAQGGQATDLDPANLDPSPFADRFASGNKAALEQLKQSIADSGQEIPILVRPNPVAPGRYQIAYGHRRAKAAQELGIPVKAYVRELDDQSLIVAQGVENSAREDLSFIERASFAHRLEAAGFQRSDIQSALAVDRAEAAKLIAVAEVVPRWLMEAIGPAPKVGRPRWQELADLLKSAEIEPRLKQASEDRTFQHKSSDDRFKVMLAVAKQRPAVAESKEPFVAKNRDGKEIASLARKGKHCRIEIDRTQNEAFAEYLMKRMPELYDEFNKGN
ncbi:MULTISPECIES: plasmid partitioning protein RepB [Rhizobium/Agrobacterium group]|uniref:plasmid partitioning protein RepB n=1 Tax=Rhizobium/Agrobacterium group TaxID=227290 RepID=UPI00130382CE|nr:MULTISPECIES: plasmid partitioning protein RepB [Rhizobium/Agrobacterium group]NSZ46258.1 plasmid partitioning protein RepB [Agrobacterium vitis]NTA25354.1 plasmid partitioning protein RepB [Allorhizobium ampelinum]